MNLNPELGECKLINKWQRYKRLRKRLLREFVATGEKASQLENTIIRRAAFNNLERVPAGTFPA